MTKNKYALYLLLCGLLLYYAFPRLSVHGQTEEVLFTVSWLFLFLCAFAGNFHSFLIALRKPERNRPLNPAKSRKSFSPFRKMRRQHASD